MAGLYSNGITNGKCGTGQSIINYILRNNLQNAYHTTVLIDYIIDVMKLESITVAAKKLKIAEAELLTIIDENKVNKIVVFNETYISVDELLCNLRRTNYEE